MRFCGPRDIAGGEEGLRRLGSVGGRGSIVDGSQGCMYVCMYICTVP